MKTILWIARDKNGDLHAFSGKPFRHCWDDDEPTVFTNWDDVPFLVRLDESEFPEVTWENSPRQVELKLIEEDEI